MDREIEMEVFRAGDYGPRGSYSEEDLEKIAADYDPAAHEAPVTVDHRQEGPALGWVRALRKIGKELVARLGGLDADFLEKLKGGAFKKRSVELYRRLATTGRPYLRAITFLGAGAPIVKGLADPVFAEPVEVAASGEAAASLEQTALSEQAASSPERAELVWIGFEEAPQNQAEPKPTPAEELYSETPADSPDLPQTNAAGDHANRRVRLAAPPASPEAASSETRASDPPSRNETPETVLYAEPPDADTLRFCEDLREEGRLLPAWEEKGIGAFLSRLDDAVPVRFGKGADALVCTARSWFRDFLKGLEPAIPMGEMASLAGNSHAASDDAAALPENCRGARLDEPSLALHRRVSCYRRAHPETNYAQALAVVFAER